MFFTTLEDKVKGRLFAQSRGVPVPKLYFVGKNFKGLNFKKLPKAYVMKTNHWSGKKAVRVVKNGKDMLAGTPFTPTESLFTDILDKHYRNPFSGEWAAGRSYLARCVTTSTALPHPYCTTHTCTVLPHHRVRVPFVGHDRGIHWTTRSRSLGHSGTSI
jgi:hypothetical protein